MSLYFDSIAPTKVKDQVLESMMPWLTSEYGNPSSKYQLGYHARHAVEEAREVIADAIGADPDEIFFTSGGSEANTWGCRGFIKGYDCISHGEALCTPIEHHSVLNALQGAEFLEVDKNGMVDYDALITKIKDSDYYILATMMVNNEIGTIEPIEKIAPLCLHEGIYFHVDAVQAFGHIPFNVHKIKGITTLSLSGHKIGAPKGVGALYIKKSVQDYYRPLICGGQQERGLRGGTENVASIVGFAEAAKLIDYEDDSIRNKAIYAWEFIRSNIPNAHLNGPSPMSESRVANNLNVSFENIYGEELAEYLSQYDICVSTGSACNSDSDEPSHVLKAIGLSDDLANGSLRISFDHDTQLRDVNILCQKIADGVQLLRG